MSRKTKTLLKRTNWYYVYTPKLGTDPLTVSILLRPQTAHLGLLLMFDDKVTLQVEWVDIVNPHHPYVIGTLQKGTLESLNLGATNGYSVQRAHHRQVSFATQCRRYMGIKWCDLRGSLGGSIQFPHRNRKEGINAKTSSLLLRY